MSSYNVLQAKLACAFAILCTAGALHAAERQILHGHIPTAVATARLQGPADRSQHLKLAIGLPLRNREALDLLLRRLYDPSDSSYHQYLQPEEFAEQFGPSEHDYQELIQFAQANGLSVTATHPNRMLLDVSGSVAQIEQVFHLNMMSYWRPDRGSFYAPDREPALDLDVPVLDISGLENYNVPRPMGLKTAPWSQAKPSVTGSGPAGLFIGSDFRAAYAPAVTLTGTGQSVGLLEFDGFFASDVKANFAQAGLPPVATQTVLLDGFSGAAGQDNIEVILDIVMASYMAPGLTKVIVYEGETPNDILNRMATDNLAKQLSSSWGYNPINATTEQIFLQYVAQGQSLLQASGDDGAYQGGVMQPSDDPNLTVVGGTSLTTASAGGAWQSESAWSGSGGGTSTTYSIPSYQQSTNMSGNGGSTSMRNIPDVALTADIQMFLIESNGHAISVGGTSAAAPLWAGFIALANQQASSSGKAVVGFLNPLLYTIGNGSNYTVDFHDITEGSNGGFSAVTGYDLTTGWGSPAGQGLINDLTGSQGPAGFTLSASPATLSIAAGANRTSTITIASQNSFSGAVSLVASGLPKGVTASFSPASATSSSALTLTAASTATGGTSTVTVTGTSGKLKETATVSLTIAVPGFTLAASSSSLNLTPGTNATSTLTVTQQNGFTSAVTFAATGLPKGVTASFSPVSSASATTLTLLAASSVTAGTVNVTVTGTSGTLKSTATINLTVAVPTFSLAASSNALSLLGGASGSSTLTVSPQNGFSGSVSLSTSPLPKGVTATFSAASTTTTSTLTFVTAATATAGNTTVTVTGTSGTLKETATIALAIVTPNYSLGASPTSISLAPGGTATSTLTVNPLNGFSNSVGLTASNLPKGVTASFSPASTTGTSTVTFTAASNAVAGTTVATITGSSSGLTNTATISVAVAVPNFSFSVAPATVSVPQGGAGSVNLTSAPVSGFSGSVTLTATGLPKGVTLAFTPAGALATSTVTLTASSSAAAGTAVVTLTGTSGTVSHSAAFSVTVIAPSANATLVNLASAFNLNGIVADGSTFTNGGLDGGSNGVGEAYSATLLGAQKTVGGTSFYFGPAAGMNAVSRQTVTLPSGQFSSLQLLATAVNGNQMGQTFTVTYVDGTTSTFTQSLSDWFTPSNFSGETKAIPMAYRDTSAGLKDNRPFMLYGYSFALTKGEQVSGITLPSNRNVVVLAMTLLP